MTLKAASETIAVAEIGGTSVKIGFADHGVPLEVTRTFSTSHLRRGAPATQLAGLLQCASVDAGLTIERVVATVPGFIGRDCDTIIHAANIPELNGIRLASNWLPRFRYPSSWSGTWFCSCSGKRLRRNCQRMRGVGCLLRHRYRCSLLGRERHFRGGGWALEIGHMPVLEPGDRQESPSGSRRTPLVRLWWTSHLHMASP